MFFLSYNAFIASGGEFVLKVSLRSDRVDLVSGDKILLVVSIPDICHGRHGRCPCNFFLAGVNFSRCNAKG